MTAKASIDIDDDCTATACTWSSRDTRVLCDNVEPDNPLLHEVRIQNDSTLPIAVDCRSYFEGGACAVFNGPVDATLGGSEDCPQSWRGYMIVQDTDARPLPIRRLERVCDGRQDVVTAIDAISYEIGLPSQQGTRHLRLTITATSS